MVRGTEPAEIGHRPAVTAFAPPVPMEKKILEFVSMLNTDSGGPNDVDLDTDLFEAGILDSFGVVDLLSFIERETGLVLADEDLEDARFASVAGIAEVLAGKTAAADILQSDASR